MPLSAVNSGNGDMTTKENYYQTTPKKYRTIIIAYLHDL